MNITLKTTIPADIYRRARAQVAETIELIGEDGTPIQPVP